MNRDIEFSGISVFAVGITALINEEFLAAISGDIGVANGQQTLGYDYFTAPDFQSLDSMFAAVSAGICQRFKPPPPEGIGFQCILLLY